MKWLSFILFFILCSGVYAFGISPGRVDLGEVKPGGVYETKFLVINEEIVDIELETQTSAEDIEVEDIIELEGGEMKSIEIKVRIPENAELGEHEEILVLKRVDNEENLSFGKGIGLKIRYNILANDNKITGYSIKENETGNEIWFVGMGLLVLLIGAGGYLLFRKYRLKNID